MERVFEAAAEVEAAYTAMRTRFETRDSGRYLRLSTEMGECVLFGRRIASREITLFAPWGAFANVAEYRVPECTPDSTGLCWDALLAVAEAVRCIHWISADAYGANAIAAVAPVRAVMLPEIGLGHVLSAEELVRFAVG